MSYYIHNVPGRLRLKIPALKRNGAAADELRKILSTVNGIATVDINPVTGSLLVNYNPKELKYQEIVRLMERKGYFEPSKALTNDEYIRNAVSKGGQIVSKAVFGSVVEKAFEGSALSLLTFLI